MIRIQIVVVFALVAEKGRLRHPKHLIVFNAIGNVDKVHAESDGGQVVVGDQAVALRALGAIKAGRERAVFANRGLLAVQRTVYGEAISYVVVFRVFYLAIAGLALGTPELVEYFAIHYG